jgi:hypothetical protein
MSPIASVIAPNKPRYAYRAREQAKRAGKTTEDIMLEENNP